MNVETGVLIYDALEYACIWQGTILCDGKDTYVDGLNVFAVSEDDIDELVNGDILADQDLGIENFYFQDAKRVPEPISIPS